MMRQLSGGCLDTAWWGDRSTGAPTIVLLHEGLGCIALWRDVPESLAAETGCPVFAYSRFGYGQSDPATLPRPMTYMHDEALSVLPELLAAEGIDDPILIGHSDGGSIAAIYAGALHQGPPPPWPSHKPLWQGLSRPSTALPDATPSVADGRDKPGHDGCQIGHNPAVTALITIAAHFFVEDLNITSIRQIKADYETTDLRARLARYHRDPDMAFRGWNDAWLDPRFRAFDITGFLPAIAAPVLALQGADDPYGTEEQLHVLRGHATAPVTAALIPGARHAPHLEAKDATLSAVTRFIADIRDQAP